VVFYECLITITIVIIVGDFSTRIPGVILKNSVCYENALYHIFI